MSFKTKNKLPISNTNYKTDEFNKFLYYSLKCSKGNGVYMGQTGRNINTRYL